MNAQYYISVSFGASAEITEMITAMLMHQGFAGAEENGKETIVSIAEEAFDVEQVESIFRSQDTQFRTKKVKQQNWNKLWETSFEPVQVEDFVRVRAAFHDAEEKVIHDIIITPKMSFGTGHHATTYLMMEEMKNIDFVGKKVIDFGTGTAVLAILAEKMGASSILAIDNDDWSIENAEENLLANNCTKISLLKDDVLGRREPVDVILANINLNIILKNIQSLNDNILPGGIILLSGLLQSDEDKMVKELTESAFGILKISNRNNWLVIACSL